MAREERKISHKDTKTLRGRESGNSRKKAQKTQNRNFTQSRLPAPSRTPTLWRTGRPIFPFSYVGQGRKAEGREAAAEGGELLGARGLLVFLSLGAFFLLWGQFCPSEDFFRLLFHPFFILP